MSKATHKETAKALLKDIAKNGDSYKPKMKANFMGIEANKKGGFYSALFEVELTIKGEAGEVNFIKNVQLPLNLLADLNIYGEEPAAKEEGAAE